MAAPKEVFTVLSFIGFLMCCIPLPWHLEVWNVGTCLYMVWTALACLNQFVNSVVWSGNTTNWAPVWCDISARIIVAVAVAIPSASLCINRRLYNIAVRTTSVTKTERHRAVMVDLAVGLGIPILEMILQYIPQGHRFDIVEDVGCWPSVYNTPVAIALVGAPPILIASISGVYSVLCIRALSQSRAQSKYILSNSSLSKDRYIRLMILAGTETALTIPFSIYLLYMNASNGRLNPWLGWEDTHYGFSRVDQIPAVIWHNIPMLVRSFNLTRSLVIVCAFVFFAFFGFAEEARKHYYLAFRRLGVPARFLWNNPFQPTGSRNKFASLSMSFINREISFLQRSGQSRQSRQSRQAKADSFIMSAPSSDVDDSLNEKKELQISVSHARYDDTSPFSPFSSAGTSWSSSAGIQSQNSMQAAVLRQEPSWIDISSVRRLSTSDAPDTPSIPAPTFDSFRSKHTPFNSSA